MNHSTSSLETLKRDVLVIGGGPAGLAAAIAAREAGCGSILLVERDRNLGGILNQCIHDGFGLEYFNEALSGPEYAARFVKMFHDLKIECMTSTIAESLSFSRVVELSTRGRLVRVEAGAVVLAMGCRERARGALSIPGDRSAGIFTAGAAQNLMNIGNIMIGRRACILGSGDIGLIMARRLVLEGASVEGVFELLPYSSGLARNIRQCLDDFNIPLNLNTTVTHIVGKGRLEGVWTSRVGADRIPVAGTEEFHPCDTLLLSVGLIPENELARGAGVVMDPLTGGAAVDENFMSSAPGIFSCGNALHVHDLADRVSLEAAAAGCCAASFAAAQGEAKPKPVARQLAVRAGRGVRHTVPQWLSGEADVTISFRPLDPGRNGRLVVRAGPDEIFRKIIPRFHPAEMMQLSLRQAGLAGHDCVEVAIE